jgi:dTDP-4-amino-4,6-dideoxygalactose transaminase
MTEFQAALLLAQLSRLEEQTARRTANAAILEEGLAAIEGVEPLRTDPRVTRRAYHLYIFRIDADGFGASRDAVVRALQAEGVPCHGGYPRPVYRSPLLQQDGTDPRAAAFPWPYQGLTVDYSAASCPNAERACGKVVWLKHPMLLADEGDMHDIIAALRKVRDHADEL